MRGGRRGRCDANDGTASVIRRVIEHSAADGARNELLNLIEVFYGGKGPAAYWRTIQKASPSRPLTIWVANRACVAFTASATAYPKVSVYR